MTDQELLAGISEGSSACEAELLQRFQSAIEARTAQLAKRHHLKFPDTDDAVQQALFTFSTHMRTVDADTARQCGIGRLALRIAGDSFRNFMKQRCRYESHYDRSAQVEEVADGRAGRASQATNWLVPMGGDAGDPFYAAFRHEIENVVHDQLLQLSDNNRLIVCERMDSVHYADIGAKLGISPDAARHRLTYLRPWLAAHLVRLLATDERERGRP